MRTQLRRETMERLEKAAPPLRGSATTGSSSSCILVSVALPLLLFLLGLVASSPFKSIYHALFLTLADNVTAARHLLALTRRPHVAGTPANADVASYMVDILSSCSFSVRSASYDVLLSYPVTRSLLLSPSPPQFSSRPVAFDLIQEIYPGDPYGTSAAEVVPTFHAYSRSGSAAGPVAYANYGRAVDFAALGEMGVNVTGAVVLARYGKIFRGDILKNVEDARPPPPPRPWCTPTPRTTAAGSAGSSTDRGCCRVESRWGPRFGELGIRRPLDGPASPGASV